MGIDCCRCVVVRIYWITHGLAPTNIRDAIRRATIWRGPQAGRRYDVGTRDGKVACRFAAGLERPDLTSCEGALGCNV